jgi:hypothetical protein
MAKSRARFLSELLGTTGLVKKSKSALAGADEIIDLSTLPSIPNSKLTNSSITINSSATSLGGSVTLTTANVAENTNLYYTDARADARIAAADTGDLSEGSNLYYTNARADARIAAADTGDLSEGSNLYYTDARADARVALVIDSAPSTLNTLNELAAALGDDASFSTTVTNSIAAKLPLTGGTLTGNLSLGDNVKAQFGASDDLEIFSNGSTALLKAGNATSDIRIESDNRIVIADRGFNEAFAVFNDDSDVKLYHDGSQKLATTATGADISGVLTADGLTVDTGANSFNALQIKASSATGGTYGLGIGSSSDFTIYANGTSKNLIRATAFGDISFYDGSGNQGLFWDSSTSRLGLGTTNPSGTLDIGGQHILSDNYNAVGAVFRRNGTYGSVISLGRQGVSDGVTLDYPADNTFSVSTANTERLKVNVSGIDVTGSVVADGLTVDGGATSPTHLFTGARGGT